MKNIVYVALFVSFTAFSMWLGYEPQFTYELITADTDNVLICRKKIKKAHNRYFGPEYARVINKESMAEECTRALPVVLSNNSSLKAYYAKDFLVLITKDGENISVRDHIGSVCPQDESDKEFASLHALGTVTIDNKTCYLQPLMFAMAPTA